MTSLIINTRLLAEYGMRTWSVLSLFGCQTPQTRWLVNNNLFLTVLEVGRSNTMALADLVSGEAHSERAGFSL